LTTGPLIFWIFDLKKEGKRILSPKKVYFGDKMPTLSTNISKNKRDRPSFLFDSSRTNIVLLRSNKKLTSGPLIFWIFDLKIAEKRFITTKNFVIFRKPSLAAPI
jgi:hypothetical protein